MTDMIHRTSFRCTREYLEDSRFPTMEDLQKQIIIKLIDYMPLEELKKIFTIVIHDPKSEEGLRILNEIEPFGDKLERELLRTLRDIQQIEIEAIIETH